MSSRQQAVARAAHPAMKSLHVILQGIAALVLAADSTLSTALSQPPLPANLRRMAMEMEQALDQGQSRLGPQEESSLLTAALAYAPELRAGARIAGSNGPIADNGPSGFYGGVYFGPIPVDDHRLAYLKMTVWGNSERGWKFEHLTRDVAVQPNDHPTWFWLTEPVTEVQAREIVRQLRELSGSANDEATDDLTARELDLFHRFEQHVDAASYVEVLSEAGRVQDGAKPSTNHLVITGYSQLPGSSRYDYLVAANFAVVGDELRFIDIRRREP